MVKRRKRQEPTLPESDSAMPTVHRYQHDLIERAQASRGASTSDAPPLRVMTQTMLDWYCLPHGNPPRPAITERNQ